MRSGNAHPDMGNVPSNNAEFVRHRERANTEHRKSGKRAMNLVRDGRKSVVLRTVSNKLSKVKPFGSYLLFTPMCGR